MMTQYVAAYQQYCWPVQSLDDLKLAPFHLLTSEGAVHIDKNHLWHMDMLSRLENHLIQQTAYHMVDLTDANSQAAGIEWWMELTRRGGEGMVIKPLDFVAKGHEVFFNQSSSVGDGNTCALSTGQSTQHRSKLSSYVGGV
jgi:protein phosphatase